MKQPQIPGRDLSNRVICSRGNKRTAYEGNFFDVCLTDDGITAVPRFGRDELIEVEGYEKEKLLWEVIDWKKVLVINSDGLVTDYKRKLSYHPKRHYRSDVSWFKKISEGNLSHEFVQEIFSPLEAKLNEIYRQFKDQ